MKPNPLIKWSLLLSVAILLAAYLLILKPRSSQAQRDSAEAARNHNSATVPAEAPASGKPADATPKPKAPKVEMSMVTAVAAESAACSAQGRNKNPEEQQHQMDLQKMIRALDPDQLETFIAEVLACTELPVDEKQWWVSRAIGSLGRTDLDRGLAALEQNLELLKNSPLVEETARYMLMPMVSQNPDKAFAKMDEILERFPSLDRKTMTLNLMMGLSPKPIDEALRLIGTRVEPFGRKDVHRSLSQVTSLCQTAQDWLSVLTYAKNYKDPQPDPNKPNGLYEEILLSLSGTLANHHYDTAQQWMQAIHLDREQYLKLGSRVARNSRPEDCEKWLAWLGRERPLPPEPEVEKDQWYSLVRGTAGIWIRKDTGTFGQWVDQQAAGDFKDMCIVEFAHEIAEEHPDTAAGWVQRMQNDENRSFMFKEILRKGNFASTADAEAFAKRYGIQ